MKTRNREEYSRFLETTDTERVRKFVGHCSIMLSVGSTYSLDNVSVITMENVTLVIFRNLTEKQFRDVANYFYAVEFSFLIK